MAELKYAEESGHWYQRDGSPAYTTVGANGAERPTTLRDARKLDLVPSVSTILQMEAAPQLVRWQIEQGLLAAITLPRLVNESDDDFIQRALEDSKQQTKKASERGSYLHGLLEVSVRDSTIPDDPVDAEFIRPVLEWLSSNLSGYTWHPEKSFASKLGFGGKLDLRGESPSSAAILDYKFKGFTPDSPKAKRLFYPQHVTQLAGYRGGLELKSCVCINLFISSTVPGVVVPKIWTPEELQAGWDAFECLRNLWRIRKDYFP